MTQAKNKGGRPPHKPTDESRQRVREHVLVGTPQEVIGELLGISQVTLRKHYGDVIKEALPEANRKIAGKLWAKAYEGDTASQIFWLKTRAGFKERSELAVGGMEGAPPMQIKVVGVDPDQPPE